VTDEYEVLAGEFRHESPPVKGSRFLAGVAPIGSAAEAEGFIERARSENPHATHHCWAYRTGRPCDHFRSSDDGEPGGSAGRPILAQIEGHGLSDTVCVVTRWFGGTKLGVGGLIRAYGGGAARALDLAPKKTLVVTERLRVTAPYACTGAIQGLLAAHRLAPVSARYGARVELVLDVPRREHSAFEALLRDRTAGRADIRWL